MRINGFTLIELLVAMTVGALILSALSWVVSRLSEQVRDSQQHDAGDQLGPVIDRLTTLLSAARAGPSDNISLSGDRLVFATVAPQSLGFGSLIVADLRVSGRPGSRSLVIGFAASGDSGRAREYLLLEGQRRIAISWAKTIDPNARAISIHFEDQWGRENELTVPLTVTGEPGCAFDPISLACR